jgi:hypothetical protein
MDDIGAWILVGVLSAGMIIVVFDTLIWRVGSR